MGKMVFRTDLLNLIFDFRLGRLCCVFRKFLANHKRDYQKWRHQPTVAHSGHGSQRTESSAQLSQSTQDESNLVWFGSVRFG